MQLINWLKSHSFDIIFFTITFLIISSVILVKPLNNLDEIWNYNFAKNVADGLVPYRDFNMLQTPLLPFIISIFFVTFGSELIVFRILAIFLITFIFYMMYKILSKLKVDNFYIVICSLLLFLLIKDYICIDYNFAILAITVTLIYLTLDSSKSSPLFLFLIGILSGCCILFKQSTGMFIAFMSVFTPILLVRTRDDFITYVKNSFIKILGILVPIVALLFYLFLTNSIYDFIDYTILGIKTFSNSIPYSRLLNSDNIVLKLLSIFMPIFIFISGFFIWKNKMHNLNNFYFYALASLIVIYPISDAIHFYIGMIPFIILLFYLFFYFINYVNKKIKCTKKIKLFLYELSKAFVSLCILYYIIISISDLQNYLTCSNKNHSILHYSQIPISEQLLEKIYNIDEYILSQDTNVYILDAEAAIYMIPLDRYYKDFNLFLKGNLGSLGEERSDRKYI